jgi:hypothetical protein
MRTMETDAAPGAVAMAAMVSFTQEI